jgi:multimeric flavodoxin WrbA
MTMETGDFVLGLVGSPNPKGRTNELVTAALEGAVRAGAEVELIQMADHVVDACRDCLPWTCVTNLGCNFEDEAFKFLSQKILNCGALVLGTPVYWWDTSGMVKYFILKMFRVFARSAPLKGLPALGLSIAGGTGNGLISGLRPVYHFFQVMQMCAIEPLPVTRFNFQESLERAGALGRILADRIPQRTPFTSLEERLLWYDGLPFLGLNRAAERRLLADLTTLAQPPGADGDTARILIRANVLAASGRLSESLTEVTRVYEIGAKAFENK